MLRWTNSLSASSGVSPSIAARSSPSMAASASTALRRSAESSAERSISSVRHSTGIPYARRSTPCRLTAIRIRASSCCNALTSLSSEVRDRPAATHPMTSTATMLPMAKSPTRPPLPLPAPESSPLAPASPPDRSVVARRPTPLALVGSSIAVVGGRSEVVGSSRPRCRRRAFH